MLEFICPVLKIDQEIKFIQAKQLTSIKKLLFVVSLLQLGIVAYEEETTSDGACLYGGLSHENDSVLVSGASQNTMAYSPSLQPYFH